MFFAAIISSLFTRGGGGEPIDHRPELKFGTESVPNGRETSGCLHTSNEGAAQTVGGGAEPIDQRSERRFGTENVPKEEADRAVPQAHTSIFH